jgi:NAD(P)-dependent dehydrogenase (short-subunit alcohol dehydrogenase family)
MMQRGRLSGKVAIITGAASGVGAAATRLFVEQGARVVAGDVREQALRREHDPATDDLALVGADVRRQDDCDRLVAAALERYGALHVLFNNAGVTVLGGIDETDDERWRTAVDVNLRAVVRLCRAAVPELRRAGGGAVVNNASITAIRGIAGALAYSTAKGGVTALTRSLAIELAPDLIRVNAICPGAIDSPMTHERFAAAPNSTAAIAALTAKHPLGRLASTEDVAYAALFLASEEAAFITGVSLPVDGGRHAA